MAIAAALGSAIIGARSASNATNAQTNAANKDIAFQRETRDLVFDRLDPFYNSGTNALAAYNFNMGLGPQPTFGATAPTITEFAGTPGSGGAWQPGSTMGPPGSQRDGGGSFGPPVAGTPGGFMVGDQRFGTREEAQAYADAHKTGGTAYGGFTTSPGYQFRLDQGSQAVQGAAGLRGGINSGATMQALTDYAQGQASQEYGSYMNRLAGLVDGGMGAASGQANAATNAAAGTSNALSNLGNAQAAGSIAQGNAWNTGIGNALGAWGYQKGLNGAGGASGGAQQGNIFNLFNGKSLFGGI